MFTPLHQFVLSDTVNADTVITALSDGFKIRSEAETALSRIYLDSFDWRLYQGGGELYSKRAGRKRALVWTIRGSDSPSETLFLDSNMPKFFSDFPQSPMREKLSSLLEMRALLPQVEIKGRIRLFKVLDEEEKTVLRFSIESHASRAPGSEAYQELRERIGLFPVRGYFDALARVKTFLEKDMGLAPLTGGLLREALAAIGRKPVDYASKLDFNFKPKDPAGAVARQIHLELLDTLEKNLPGTRANLDSEFLHDLRVAVRRTRSALTQIKSVFTPDAVEAFKPRLAWIGQITGPSRDMDVYLLDYDAYRSTLPVQFQPDLDPLHAFLVAHQKSAYRSMVNKLNSSDFLALLNDWRLFLNDTRGPEEGASAADVPIKELADKRVYRIYKRVLAEGLAINSTSPAEAFHELRKNCKKLRYLIEFFQSLYPKTRVRPLIKALKVLLDNLGTFQDTEVQAGKLREFAHQMVQEGKVPADTLLAMGMLVDGLLRRQQEARQDFSSFFKVFASRENQMEFKALFSVVSGSGKQG